MSEVPHVRIVPISDLVLDNKNANKGAKRGRKLIDESLKSFGAIRSVGLDKAQRIVAGNKTVEAARAQGYTHVAIIESDGKTLVAVQRNDIDLDTPEGRAAAIADNRTSELDLEWDNVVLTDLGKVLSLDKLGFTIQEQKGIGIEVAEQQVPGPQIDQAAELQKKWGTERGQIWEIGDHRLMCGDSTDPRDVETLMESRRVPCMWTDPPYGVSYVGKTKDELTIQNDTRDGLLPLLKSAFSNADTRALEDGSAVYVAHPAGALQVEFTSAFVGTGWRIHETLVWVKDTTKWPRRSNDGAPIRLAILFAVALALDFPNSRGCEVCRLGEARPHRALAGLFPVVRRR
jgi:hypothetical protein